MTAPFVPPPNPNAIRSTEQHNLGQPGFQGGFTQPGVENTYGDMRDIISQSGGGMGMLDWIPVLSQLRGLFQAQQMGQQGHPIMAALMGGMSMLPDGHGAANTIETAAKKAAPGAEKIVEAAMTGRHAVLRADYIATNNQATARRLAEEYAGTPEHRAFVEALTARHGPEITVYRAGAVRPGKFQSFVTDPTHASFFSRRKNQVVEPYKVRPEDVAFDGARDDTELIVNGSLVVPGNQGGNQVRSTPMTIRGGGK